MERVDRKVEILNRLIREVKVKMSEAEVRVGGVTYELYTDINNIKPYEIIDVGLDEELEKEITSEIEILKETLEYLEDERANLITEEVKEVRLTLEELSGERILYITDKWG